MTRRVNGAQAVTDNVAHKINPGVTGALAWSPDGAILAAGFSPIRLYSGKTADALGELKSLPSTPGALAFSADGKTLLASGDALTQVLDMTSGRLRGALLGFQDGAYLVLRADGHWCG